MGGLPWWKTGCLGLVVAVGIGFFIFTVVEGGKGFDVPIDGMQCGAEMNGYHVHAQLSLFNVGQQVFIPEGVGWSVRSHCWYWLHTHDASGVIHVEGPDKSFAPTLGTFFDVWHQPLSRSRFLSYQVRSGQTMRVYVNQAPYSGNPRSIRLRPHTLIALEIGPPFRAPPQYNFGQE